MLKKILSIKGAQQLTMNELKKIKGASGTVICPMCEDGSKLLCYSASSYFQCMVTCCP